MRYRSRWSRSRGHRLLSGGSGSVPGSSPEEEGGRGRERRRGRRGEERKGEGGERGMLLCTSLWRTNSQSTRLHRPLVQAETDVPPGEREREIRAIPIIPTSG